MRLSAVLLTMMMSLGALQANLSQWKQLLDRQGRFQVMMPSKAEHLQNSLKLEGSQELSYDLFVSAKDSKTVFMILAAEYPLAIPEAERSHSLEYFLNGILGHNGQNKLIFADLIPMQGHTSLDFHMITRGAAQLRGRAIITGDTLYVLAMEVHSHEINEKLFVDFINSFLLHSKK